VHAFNARAVARSVGVEILDDPERPCGLFIANTRVLWERFRAVRATDAEIFAATDPIDRHTERSVDIASGAIDGRAFYGHRRYGESFLPFQRIAVAAGLASLAPTQLLIHPTYGPWFALRAVILHAGTPPATQPLAPSCTCDGSCREAFDRAMRAEGPDAWRVWLAARDACTVGREYRYSEAQLAYHYTKDPRFLDEDEPAR
jgi:cyanocobalamin reductase (cyanide-eliminating) / alkylcobalamin dealkylase